MPIIEEHFESLSNFGERAHIFGKRKGSARYIEENSDDNTYNNLILLCAKHHKLIDDHPAQYPANTLFSIKSDHEMRISQNPLIQSHGDVALVKGIFSIAPFMYFNNLINTQNPNMFNTDIFEILDIENSLEEFYEYDYPFKHPELQQKTELMFYFLRELLYLVRDQDIFNVQSNGDRNIACLISNCDPQAIQNSWKYFNLFRSSFKSWYSYCKACYGV